MYYITKMFGPFPFAHRQHKHSGHCSLIHGHNWYFEICLKSGDLDENGFVYDFGKFKWLKSWLEETFDHTIVINEDDPYHGLFHVLHEQGLMKMITLRNCSSEALAKHVYQYIQDRMMKQPSSDRNLELLWVKVYEDEKNKAIYKPEDNQ